MNKISPSKIRTHLRLIIALALILYPGATPLTLAAGHSPSSSVEGDLEKEELLDIDDPPDTTIKLSGPFSMGVELEAEYGVEEGFDLDTSTDDDLATLSASVGLALTCDPGTWWIGYIEGELSRELIDDPTGEDRSETTLTIDQAFLGMHFYDGRISVRLGRQQFKDEREWLYDEDLDAAKISLISPRAGAEFSVARERLVDKDLLHAEENKRVNYYLAYTRYAFNEDAEAGAYLFIRKDKTDDREEPILVGVRSTGEIAEGTEQWVELAYVTGKESDVKLRGWAVDVGVSRQFKMMLRPYLTLGVAHGSGDDDPGDKRDTSFRQSGLHDNSDRLHGVAKYKYYGEVFDPELSNITILTAGIGVRPPPRRWSVELLWHGFRQVKRSDEVRGSSLDLAPAGLDKELGQELDLVAGYKQKSPKIKSELTLGWFKPAKAFPSGAADAFIGSAKISFEF